MKCADAGADLVRITVQGNREAKACKLIREKLDELVRHGNIPFRTSISSSGQSGLYWRTMYLSARNNASCGGYDLRWCLVQRVTYEWNELRAS